jgi:hypothetical protein
MNWLSMAKGYVLNILVQHYGKILGLAAVIGSGTFFSNLMLDLSNGTVTDDQFHSLLSQASGVQLVLLGIVMAVIKLRK